MTQNSHLQNKSWYLFGNVGWQVLVGWWWCGWWMRCFCVTLTCWWELVVDEMRCSGPKSRIWASHLPLSLLSFTQEDTAPTSLSLLSLHVVQRMRRILRERRHHPIPSAILLIFWNSGIPLLLAFYWETWKGAVAETRPVDGLPGWLVERKFHVFLRI